MDRGIFKVPQSEAHPDHVDESVLHWDLDPRAASSSTYQGMLFLTDVARGEGSFECVPSILAELDRYLYTHPGPVLDVPVDLTGHDVVEVPARAGDLVIWSARLPHQGGRNRSAQPRVSLAVTMRAEGTDAERQERIECWRQKRAPAWWRGWKGQIDPEPGEPADLTPLGRKLVGVDRWP
jgi:ectoine hydroxylase-related dioxygenase (phytanoyl-CoA dioxygenase family)